MLSSERILGKGISPGRTKVLRLALTVTSVAILALITLGGVVRVSGSGLGCPDWPLCHGEVLPPIEAHAVIEFSHRILASIVGGLVMVSAAIVWIKCRTNRRVVLPMVFAVGLVILQVGLGAITVLMKLSPVIVTLHLAVAEILFGVVLISLARSSTWLAVRDHFPLTGLYQLAIAAAVMTFLALLSGSFVVAQGAGFTCSDWPLCVDGSLPSSNLGWINMMHRIVVAISGVSVMAVVILGWGNKDIPYVIRAAIAMVLLGFVAQTLVGALNPWSGFEAIYRVIHLMLGTVLWGSTIYLWALIQQHRYLRPPERSLS